jgi:deoxyribose-phosphate aldolase
MTPDWPMPSTFRFGASDLLDDILAVLSGTQSASAAASSY